MDNLENERWVSREELFKMVWATPMQKLAKEFGTSDVALAKKCKKLGIPRPPRGYWRRVECGERVAVPKLPAAKSQQPNGVYIYRTIVDPREVELARRTKERVAAMLPPETTVNVDEVLTKPHKLVRRTKALFAKAKPNDFGALSGRWEEGCLNIRVSRTGADRSLRIMDALLKAVERYGFEIETENERRIATCLVSGDTRLEIQLFERAKRFENDLSKVRKEDLWRHQRFRYEPTGEFEITLSRWPLNQRHWKDKESLPLEIRLAGIVAEIIESAELVRMHKEERRKAELERLEGQRRAEEQRRLEELESERLRSLERLAVEWRRSGELRDFLNSCEWHFAQKNSGVHLSSAEHQWLRWAREHADRLDPMKNGELEILVSERFGTKTNG